MNPELREQMLEISPTLVSDMLAAIKSGNAFMAITPYGTLAVLCSHANAVTVAFDGWMVATFRSCSEKQQHAYMTVHKYVPRTPAYAWLMSELLAEFAPRRKLLTNRSGGYWLIRSDDHYPHDMRWAESYRCVIPFDTCLPGTEEYVNYMNATTFTGATLRPPDLVEFGLNGIPIGPMTLAEIGACSGVLFDARN